ncbi:MAG TPA: sugar transferase, partial [Spirillospora sp.]|nr:sugar transferase [Spirillospora sp.]
MGIVGRAGSRDEAQMQCRLVVPVARRRARGRSKVALDVVLATTLLLLLVPLMLVIALCIVLESPGPVFYRAERIGRHGRPLRMLKFRKMLPQARGGALTVAGDPRLTRIGRLLLATKLDELPQLLHVVRGEMSLIGPRPEDPGFVARYPEQFAEILVARPGMTGLSQLAFAHEGEVLAPQDPVEAYVGSILPQKLG